MRNRFPTAGADGVLRDFEVASLQADCAKSFLAAHPILYLLFGGHLLVAAKLLIQPRSTCSFRNNDRSPLATFRNNDIAHLYDASRILAIAAACLPHSRVSLFSLFRPFSVRA